MLPKAVYQMLPMSLTNFQILLIFSITYLLSFQFFWKEEKTMQNKINKIDNKSKKILTLNLFISFDQKTSFFFEMNWLSLVLCLGIVFNNFFKKPSRLMNIFNYISEVSNQFSIALKTKKDGSKMVFPAIFMIFLLTNLMGLIPNMFTPSSHMNFNMFLSLPLWAGFCMYGWKNFTNKMFAHLVPNGTPMPLISFMVLIELISNFIRPITLSIRMMANMVSGHLLLTLAGNAMMELNILQKLIMVNTQLILVMLEIGVAMIQAYVFCMLLTLYSDESEY